MKKNDYFIDVSAYQPANLQDICAKAGTNKTIIKVSEGTHWLSPVRQQQADSSEPVGYYHFARFGGSVDKARDEAYYFISNLPKKKVRYLVCDYEDSASSNKPANTNAVLAFMDVCHSHGYKPIFYSYKPFTLCNLDDYHRILYKYPNSLWIAAYPNNNVTPQPVWSVFPSMDGVRWWQFTSRGIESGLDKNIVLLDDETSSSSTTTKDFKGGLAMEFTFEVTGDKNFSKGTVFYANTTRGIYRGLRHYDEWTSLKNIYKDCTGRDMPHYKWNAGAPWYMRAIQGACLKEIK